MTKKEYFEHHKKFCDDMQSITKAKNADYTGKGDDPFANFRKIEDLTNGAVSVEAGFLTRMSDKFSRIGSFMQKGTLEVKDESIHDTLIDLANYCALFSGYLKEKFCKQPSEPESSSIVEYRGALPSHLQQGCKHEKCFVANGKDPRFGECVACGLEVRMSGI